VTSVFICTWERLTCKVSFNWNFDYYYSVALTAVLEETHAGLS